jgi:uncharacterized protein YggE
MVTLGSFTRNSGPSLHETALRNAIEEARKEAGVLAKEMGRQLGDILTIAQVEVEAGAARGRGGEEEEERERAKIMNDSNPQTTMTEKAQLRVVFQVK